MIRNFNRKFCKVSLDGEAYFQVAKNKKRPFIIKRIIYK